MHGQGKRLEGTRKRSTLPAEPKAIRNDAGLNLTEQTLARASIVMSERGCDVHHSLTANGNKIKEKQRNQSKMA
jgi:hypothetical protein